MPNYTAVVNDKVRWNHTNLFRRWDARKIPYDIIPGKRLFIQFVRTEFVEHFLAGSYSHLLMLDDDAVCPQDFLERMLVWDKDIIGLPYVGRFPTGSPEEPWEICVKVWKDEFHGWNQDNLRNLRDAEMDQGMIQVEGIGTHCMLIKRRVFTEKGIPDPDMPRYVDLDDKASFHEEHLLGKPYFVMPKTGTEDLYYCYRAWRKGFEVWCDTDRFAGHVGTPPVLGRLALPWADPSRSTP